MTFRVAPAKIDFIVKNYVSVRLIAQKPGGDTDSADDPFRRIPTSPREIKNRSKKQERLSLYMKATDGICSLKKTAENLQTHVPAPLCGGCTACFEVFKAFSIGKKARFLNQIKR